MAYDQEIVDEVVERLSEGEPLAVMCRDKHLPDPSTIWKWQQGDSEQAKKAAKDIERARDVGYDAIAQRLRETARGRGDSFGDVHRDKLIIDTDLKLLSKWSKRYSDKHLHEHTGEGGGPVEMITKLEICGPDDD